MSLNRNIYTLLRGFCHLFITSQNSKVGHFSGSGEPANATAGTFSNQTNMQLPKKWSSAAKYFKIPMLAGLFLFVSHSLPAQSWQGMGSGLNRGAKNFHLDSTNNLLYVLGNILLVDDSIPIRGIAVWEGSRWDSVPVVNQYYPHNLISYRGSFYFEGPNCLYAYDGIQVDTIPTAGGTIFSMMEYQGNLLVLGDFDTLNGIYSPNIISYDGTNWTAIPTPAGLRELFRGVEYNGELYCSGSFTINGAHGNIAKWDGTDWQVIDGIPFANAWGYGITDMIVYRGELWIAGSFHQGYGCQYKGMVKWNGTHFLDCGIGDLLSVFHIRSMAVLNDQLFLGGSFTKIADIPISGIAKWNGIEWCGIGYSTTDTRHPVAITVYNNELILSGGFKEINGDSLSHIARWIPNSYTDTCGIVISVEEAVKTTPKLSIWPNPTQNQIHLEAEMPTPGDARISLFDLQGRVLKTEVVSTSGGQARTTLEVSQLPAGIYAVHIQTNDYATTQKVVISR